MGAAEAEEKEVEETERRRDARSATT